MPTSNSLSPSTTDKHMGEIQLYSQRQLSPFMGLVYVASISLARAISNDGIFWQIQVSCETQQHHLGLSHAGLVRRYVLWGVWSKQAGLKAMPLDPMLDTPKDEVIENQLIPALESSLQHMPFESKDHYELWILDSLENLPVALISTRIDGYNLDLLKPAHWRASTHSKRDFLPVLTHITTDPLLKLEQMISDNTCCPIRSQWFLRDDTGNGTGVTAQNLELELHHRILENEKFPELLIREHWPNLDTQLLAREYHNWLAPRILTLQNLSLATRARLELAAQKYAVETSQLINLYPQIADQKIINRILVEARLRTASAHDA
jgi:hypothetical protein